MSKFLPGKKEQKFVSIKEAAAILGVSSKTLRRWDKAGALPSSRTKGGHRRYSFAQISKFKEQKDTKEVIKRVEPPQIYAPLHTNQKKVLLIGGLSLLLLLNIGLINTYKLAQKETKLAKTPTGGRVLQAATSFVNPRFNINVPTFFRDSVTFENGLTAEETASLADVDISGTLTAPADLTINPTGADVILNSNLIMNDAFTLQIGGLTGTVYNALANAGEAPEESAISSDNDLYIGGDLEIDGTLYATLATAPDATTLDSVDSGSFLRSDESDSFTSGTLTISSGTTLSVEGSFSLQNNGSIGSGFNLSPDVDLGADLGTASLRYNNIYAANLTIDSGSTFSGQLLVTYNPADTTFAESSIRVNVTTPSTNEQLLGIGQAGEERAAIDAEGDLTIGYDGIAGSSIPASSNPFNVYDHGTNLITSIDATGIATFQNSTDSTSGFLVYDADGGTPILNIDTTNERVGIGIASPNEQLEITGNFRLPTTTASTGIIYSSSSTLLHTFGTNNFFAGVGAGNLTLTGTSNTGVGPSALDALTDGGSNTALGFEAGTSLTGGDSNVAVGYRALASNASGNQNTALGWLALEDNTASNNIAIGAQALLNNTSGNSNIAIGIQAMLQNTTAGSNNAIGFQTLRNVTGGSNTALGYQAGLSVNLNGNISNNTLLGYQAGTALVTNGNNNTLIGYGAGDNLTSGDSNIVLGYNIDAPSATSTQTLNIGNLIFGNSIDGTGTTLSSGNIGIGTNNPTARLDISLSTAAASDNTAFQITSEQTTAAAATLRGARIFSSFNSTTGTQTGVNGLDVSSRTIGSGGTVSSMVGISATSSVASGTTVADLRLFRAAAPSNSGTLTTLYGVYIDSMTAGSTNYALYSAGGQSYHAGNFGIGNTSPALALHVGDSTVTDGTNLLRLEDSNSTCDFNADTGTPSCGSDLTLKKDIASLSTGEVLGKINNLNLVSYRWQTDTANAPLQYGFIAQEVATQFPHLVNDNLWVDGTQRKFLNTGGLLPFVVGAIQEQQLQIKALESLNSGPTELVEETQNIELEEVSQTLASLQERLSLLEGELALLKNEELTATNSAVLAADTDLVTASDLVITNGLNVGTLSIEETGINNIGVLSLQNLALGDIEFMGGLAKIDTKGNLYLEEGQIVGNNSFRGSEILPAGETVVKVEREWESPPASITLTPNYNTNVWVTEKSEIGFTINLEKSPLEEASIDWLAIW